MRDSAITERRRFPYESDHPAPASGSTNATSFRNASPFDGGDDVGSALLALIATGALDLPLPGGGDTAARFTALSEIAARDLSLARLAEGHTDAIAILREANHDTGVGAYGVWAADGFDARIDAVRTRQGFILCGRRRYCSGARVLDRALVTAHTDEGLRLFDVDLGSVGIVPVEASWRAVGMAATESLEVTFDDVCVPFEAAVGSPGFYLSRPGFWHGAVGVASCWYGGALGAFRMLKTHLAKSPATGHQLAHLGAIAASIDTMKTMLDAAAHAIDDDPSDLHRAAQLRALTLRHVVEQGCQEVLSRTGRAGGTWPLVFDAEHAQRAADLVVYLRQHHAERDLEGLGRLVVGGAA